MTSTLMKKEVELVSPASEDLIALLKSATRLLRSKEISRPMLNEALRQCEFLRIDILAKQASRVR